MQLLPRAPSRTHLLAVLVVFVVVACAPAAPRASARPTGKSWWCTRDRAVQTWSVCERSREDCEATARHVREDAAKDGGPNAEIDACHPQGTAICYTFRVRHLGQDNFLCYETVADCEAGVRRRRAEPDDYDELSSCGPWD
jgi:hypothetical protein